MVVQWGMGRGLSTTVCQRVSITRAILHDREVEYGYLPLEALLHAHGIDPTRTYVMTPIPHGRTLYVQETIEAL